MIIALAAVGALFALVAFQRPGAGLLLTLLVGFAQDPVRKVLPNEPVLMTAAIVVIFAATALGAFARGLPLSLEPVFRLHPGLRVPTTLFLALCAVQIGVTLVRTFSPQLVAIGVIEYLAPAAGLVFAYAYGTDRMRVVRFLSLYVVGVAVLATGVYLDVFGVSSKLLDPVGVGVHIYTSTGKLELPSGFFRAAESAAWHSAAGLCLLVVLVVSRFWRWGWTSAVLLGLHLAGAILLCGRRKAIVEVLVFVGVYGALLALYRRGATKLAAFLFAAGLAAFGFQWFLISEERRDIYRPYLERSADLGDELFARFELMTVDLVRGAIYENGWLGSGAGMGGGGAQYFGGGVTAVGGGGESGIGRIAAELGVLGLVLAFWLTIALFVATRRILTWCGRNADEHSMAEGFGAFLVANLLVFATAAQIFGDPMVLLMLGMLCGFMLAAPPRVRASAVAGLRKSTRAPRRVPAASWSEHATDS
jgi:hypothetical protein